MHIRTYTDEIFPKPPFPLCDGFWRRPALKFIPGGVVLRAVRAVYHPHAMDYATLAHPDKCSVGITPRIQSLFLPHPLRVVIKRVHFPSQIAEFTQKREKSAVRPTFVRYHVLRDCNARSSDRSVKTSRGRRGHPLERAAGTITNFWCDKVVHHKKIAGDFVLVSTTSVSRLCRLGR